MLQMDTQFYAHFTWISRNKISNIQNINKKIVKMEQHE